MCRVAKPLAPKAPGNRVTGDQPFHITDIAAAAQRVRVVADKAMSPVAGIAVLATQGAAIHAHAHADARAPGDVCAMVQALQRAPAPLCLQGAHAVVFYAHLSKGLAQRCLQQRACPIIGQATGFAGHAAANIGCGQLHQPVTQDKWPTGNNANCAQGRFTDAAKCATLFDHADDLLRQRIGLTDFSRGL